MRRLFILFAYSIISVNLLAQESEAEQDSMVAVSVEQLYEIILQNHPVVKQAMLLDDAARQEILYARGFFDPKIEIQYDAKRFKDTEYYNIWDNVIKVPTWINTDLKLGYERNSGQFLDEGLTVPEDGLIYAGVSIPVGRGLFIDSRRATLRQAQLMSSIADVVIIKIVNKTLLQANKDYWNWYWSFNNFQLYNEALQLAEVRFRAIKNNVEYGDYAPIDSVEAKIQVQTRSIERRQAYVDFINSGLILSNHLWNEEGMPVILSENAFPLAPDSLWVDMSEEVLYTLMDSARQNHPELLKLGLKQQQLEIERRLSQENLKPVLNFNYNFLTETTGSPLDRNGQFFSNDYKLGLEFSFPLFLRKERAKLQKTNIKIIENNLDQLQTRREIINEINTSFNELQTLFDLMEEQARMVNNYEDLLSAEILNFENGESSVFLVNSRESKLIEARLKMVAFEVKYQKAKATLLWAAGVTNLEL